MSKHQSTSTNPTPGNIKSTSEVKEAARKARGDCFASESSSHTQFFKARKHGNGYERITTDEYFGIPESMSGTSDSFHCLHKRDGKVYTQKGLLKRNLKKGLDQIPTDPRWTKSCELSCGWDMAKNLEFLVKDPTIGQQKERLLAHLEDFAQLSCNGYKIDHLCSVCVILDYLMETLAKNPDQKEVTMLLLQSTTKPIRMSNALDIVKFFNEISHYMGFLGYLLIRVEEDSMFDVISAALLWHLSAPDSMRSNDVATLRHTLIAAAPELFQTATRMIAVAKSHRFPTYLAIALLLACNSVDICLEMIKENIIENIFYRFDPYFPDKKLPLYDDIPVNLQDLNLKLGDSSVHMSTTMTLLLVLLKTMKDHLEKNPKYSLLLPCPDTFSQRCFVWAYRYECRARHHYHQRNTLTVIAMSLLHCFGKRLEGFSELLMADIMTLSVKTELPPRNDWTGTVNINTSQKDVKFKKLLIYFSVHLLKVFPYNKYMVESRYWLVGLMYLLDPGLSSLRARWSQALFAELRKAALQALVCAVPRCSPHLVKEYGLIRRTMWYIEWYSEKPYELPILYWCVRLLQVTIYQRGDPTRKTSMNDMYNTHGIIILIHLCYRLLDQKLPPVIEKVQAIISLCLRLLTSAVESNANITCCVYPSIKWPSTVNALANRMLNVVLFSMEKYYIISERWLISLLNLIWEAIIWRKEYREIFIARDGIFKLLDIITMTRPPVQCIALALVCDATRAGNVGQLVSWRANLGAASAQPNVVKRGATIATLLASVFRDDCIKMGVQLDDNNVIKDLESPIMSSEMRKHIKSDDFRNAKSRRTPVCFAAADLAGSRMSKAYAILSMLSEDLESKVTLADEAYNLYKNIRLEPEDETILVLCTHYLTMKLNEVWVETKAQSSGFLPSDEDVLEEFLHIGKGWSKEIKRQQENVLEIRRKKESEEENSLYEFLGRVRLNIALDALREVRCIARSADRERITHALIHDAVLAHHRRSLSGKAMLRTYGHTLDDQNVTGQNMKVYSIFPGREKFKENNIKTCSP